MIKGVKNRAVHYDLRWQQAPRLKNCGPRDGITQAASIESVNLRRLVGGIVRGLIGNNLLKTQNRCYGRAAGGSLPSFLELFPLTSERLPTRKCALYNATTRGGFLEISISIA